MNLGNSISINTQYCPMNDDVASAVLELRMTTCHTYLYLKRTLTENDDQIKGQFKESSFEGKKNIGRHMFISALAPQHIRAAEGREVL